jgi:hypothetical protein
MNDPLQVASFRIRGRAERVQDVADVPATPKGPAPTYAAAREGTDKQHELTRIVTLNEHSDDMAEQIEREVKRHLPPYVAVQASVQFARGSILLECTVTLLVWGGKVVLDLLKDEAQQAAANIVKTAVQRVMGRMVASLNMTRDMMPMEVTVTSEGTTLLERQSIPAQAASAAEQQISSRSGGIALVKPFMVLTLFILLVQILLVLDRFVAVSFKP